MSYLTKLARFNRLYNVINNLEKVAVSIGAVQKAVGAAGGRTSARQAKRLVKYENPFEFNRTAYKNLRGSAGQTEAKGLQRAATASDEQILKLRAEQRQLSKQLKDASAEDAKGLRAKLVENQRNQSARIKEVNTQLQGGDSATLQRARNLQNKSTKYRAKAGTEVQGKAPSTSSVEEAALGEGGQLSKQYQKLLKDKGLASDAQALSRGEASPEMTKAWRSFQKSNPQANELEFLAQSRIQSQMRNAMGNRQGGGMFAEAGNVGATKNLANTLQEGKGFHNYNQEMVNALKQEGRAENVLNTARSLQTSPKTLEEATQGLVDFHANSTLPMPSNLSKGHIRRFQNDFRQAERLAKANPNGLADVTHQDLMVQRAQQQQQLAKQQFVDTNAQQLLQSGKAADLGAAQQQAQTMFQQSQTPAQMVPLIPTQQVAQKYTGSVVPHAGAPTNLQPTPLNQTQQSIINQVQAQNLPKQQAATFNQTFTAPTEKAVKSNVTQAQNQATNQQRQTSQARGADNQSGNFLGQYGMPLAIGTGVLGAGYLYANSGNQQQPNPSQGGV